MSWVLCEDLLNFNERDLDYCLDGLNEGKYWMKLCFEVFSVFIKKVWNLKLVVCKKCKVYNYYVIFLWNF